MFIRRYTRLKLSAAILMASFAAVACDDDSTGLEDLIEWEAELEGVGQHADVVAAALAVSDDDSFAAQIDVEDATAEAVFAWRIATGTCAAPGTRVGDADDYPELTIEEDGTASAEASITAVLDIDEDYIVQIVDENGEDEVVVACGALSRS